MPRDLVGKRVIDIANKRFGNLNVIRFSGLNKYYEATWLCVCDCGKKKIILGHSLRRKKNPIRSCGCASINARYKVRDLVGQRFNRLIVESFAFLKNNKAYWNCLCDCGHRHVYTVKNLRIRKRCRHCLVKDDLYWVTKWVKRNLLRKGERFSGRRNLSVDLVVTKALRAKNHFPYMSFIGKCERWRYASIDKIDPKKDYSDIKNIRIIPLWLNEAKMRMTYAKLKKLMKHYLNIKGKL